jgi:hypothetical protein
MRHAEFSAYVFVVAIISISLSFGDDKPTKSTKPLTPDEIGIYKVVLAHYSSKEAGMLNVSIRTFPLDPESDRNGRSKGGCLQDMELENLTSASRTFHELTPDVLSGKNMKLVDPKKHAQVVRSNDPDKTMRHGKSVESAVASAFATGLFSMSEIAFDKERRHAVVSYIFWCGFLCGNGSTLVFEKTGQEWRRTNRDCGGWIS